LLSSRETNRLVTPDRGTVKRKKYALENSNSRIGVVGQFTLGIWADSDGDGDGDAHSRIL
jgi:hypothetical protein